jgi:hypothetical protein
LTHDAPRRKIFAPAVAMHAARHFRTFRFAIFLCAFAPLCACGNRGSSSPSESASNAQASSGSNLAEPPLDQQTEQKLDPLTKDDVDLYLKVMRAAAERVKNPTPSDLAALDGAKKILAGSGTGRVPTREDAKTLARANLVATSMDQIVVEEMKLDARAYRGIAEAVEAVVSSPSQGGDSRGGAAPPAKGPATPLEKRLSDVNSTNEKFLAPFRVEIQQLAAVVRNPANLPK